MDKLERNTVGSGAAPDKNTSPEIHTQTKKKRISNTPSSKDAPAQMAVPFKWKRVIVICLCVILIGIAVTIAVLIPMFRDYQKLKSTKTELEKKYDDLTLERERLELISQYIGTEEYLEIYAKYKMGYIMPNEIVLDITDNDDAPKDDMSKSDDAKGSGDTGDSGN